jgi:hypothetical protein
VPVLVEPLLEYATAQIIGLTLHDRQNRSHQRRITNARLLGRFAEPGRLECSRGRLSWHDKV